MRDTNGAAVVIEPATSDGEMSDDVYTGLTVDKRVILVALRCHLVFFSQLHVCLFSVR